MNSKNIGNAIFSAGSPAGATPSNSPDGRPGGKSGREAVRVILKFMTLKFDTRAAQKNMDKELDRLNLDENPRLVRALDRAVYDAAFDAETLLTNYIERETGLPRKRARRRAYIKLPKAKYKTRKKVDRRRWEYQIKTLGGALRVHVGRLPFEFVEGARGRQELQIGSGGGVGGKRYRHAFLLPKGNYQGKRFPGPDLTKSKTIRLYQRRRDKTIKAITPPKISIRKIYRAKKPAITRYFLRQAERKIKRVYGNELLKNG